MRLGGRNIGLLALCTSLGFQFRQLRILHSLFGDSRPRRNLLPPIVIEPNRTGEAMKLNYYNTVTNATSSLSNNPSTKASSSSATKIVKLLPDELKQKSDLAEELEERLIQHWEPTAKHMHVNVPFAIPRQTMIDHDAVTVAVHADVDRLNRLLYLIRRWNGPVSAALLIRRPSDIGKLVRYYSLHQGDLGRTDFHLIMESYEGSDYPHNLLRELALSSVETDYFLALDVDFVTPPNAAPAMQKMIQQDPRMQAALRNRTWMVLPAFNRNMKIRINETNVLTFEKTKKLPKNKPDIIRMWDNGAVEPFHLERFVWGHGATNYDKWYDEKKLLKDQSFYMTFYEIGFEPYVLGYKHPDIQLPQYWPWFRGFGTCAGEQSCPSLSCLISLKTHKQDVIPPHPFFYIYFVVKRLQQVYLFCGSSLYGISIWCITRLVCCSFTP